MQEKIEAANEEAQREAMRAQQAKASGSRRSPAREEEGIIESLSRNTMVRQLGRTAAREITRGLLGVLGLGGTTRKRR